MLRPKRITLLAAFAAFALSITLANRCFASWAYVPQEIRIMQSDLVVVGKIVKPDKDIVRNGRTYAVGVIKPTEVLKGNPMKKADIRIAWPSRRGGGIAVSTDIGYRVGQEGVWVLTADKKLPVYWATYPTDHQPLAKLAEFKKKMANVKNINWGEKKGGLQIGMIVEQRDLRKSKVQVNGRPVKAIGQLTVYPLLKNATDKLIHVVNNYQDQPFSLTFTDDDDSPIDVKLYGNQPAKSVPLRQHNFIKVPPGGVSPISYGFGLPTLTEAGVYSIKLTYRNKRGGEALKIEAVWKGSATSPTVKIDVPAKNK